MGCDIHAMTEIKRNGKWEAVGKIFKHPYYRPEEPINNWNQEFTSDPIEERNYDLFAILADVRNGYGFAGVDTGEGFKPIAEPKGVPEDASLEYVNDVEEWDGDGHSHSWLTLRELLDYDWHNQITTHRGVIKESAWKEFKEKGIPDESYGSVVGGNVKTVTSRQYEKILADPSLRESDVDYYIHVTWIEKYYDCVKRFVNEVIPSLQKLGEPENVRIVFFFDN